MSRMHVNTAGIAASAGRLTKTNENIRDSFADVRKAISKLDSSWDGAASEFAVSKFHEIDKECSQRRYDAVKENIDYLNRIINPGFVATESKNASLADMFK